LAPGRLLPLLAVAASAAALGGCGGSDEEPRASSTTPTTSTTTEAAATPLRSRLEAELRRLLKSGDSAQSVDVDCVIEELRSTLSNDLVEAATDAAASGDEIPKAAVDAAYAAGQKCSKR
jgi:hypothetical protein